MGMKTCSFLSQKRIKNLVRIALYIAELEILNRVWPSLSFEVLEGAEDSVSLISVIV
jgi:hypothetical protein